MKKTGMKLVAVVTAMVMMCMALTGCGQKLAPADQTVSALLDLIIADKTEPMMTLLGYESEEDVYNAFFEDGVAAVQDTEIVDELKSGFDSMGLEMTEEELQEFSDAMASLVEKVTYSAEIKSEDSDSVVVTVKINGISEDELEQIIMDAATVMSDSLTENLTEDDALAIMNGDMSVVTPYMQQYVKDIIAGVTAMEPVAEPYEFDVTCEKLAVEVGDKEKIAWLPADMNDFEAEVEVALYQ